MKDSKKKKVGYLLLIFLFFIGSVFFSYRSILAICDIHRSENWEETTAKIIATDFRIRQGGKGTTYWVLVDYEYFHSEKIFRGNKISFGYDSGSKKYENALYQVFKNAKMIKVFVNPNNPTESVIVKGFSDAVLFQIFFAISFCVFTIIYLIALFSEQKITKKVGFLVVSFWLLGFIILHFVHIPIENKIIIIN